MDVISAWIKAILSLVRECLSSAGQEQGKEKNLLLGRLCGQGNGLRHDAGTKTVLLQSSLPWGFCRGTQNWSSQMRWSTPSL